MNRFPWPALHLARECNGLAPGYPFLLPGTTSAAERVLGSVAILRISTSCGRGPDAFDVALDPATGRVRAVSLRLSTDVRDARLAAVHEQLHASGLIRGWRDEPYPLRDRQGGEHATIERAASRFWGTLTFGAHCNGYVADASGRPTHLWVARRADSKPTDPGRLDNLIGGGVPRGQSPRETVIREGWEEAGLEPGRLAGLVEGRVIEVECDVPEGRQHERVFVFDLPLPDDLVPRNLDGEVAEHRLMTVAEALGRAAAGEMTTDAALVTLDFALRHRLIEPGRAEPVPTATAWSLSPAQLRAFEALGSPAW